MTTVTDGNCDLAAAGTVINISEGAMASDKDIALDYVGTRLTRHHYAQR